MKATTKTILSIFITNLGKYNEGELVGEWLSLPCSDQELDALLKRIGINEQYEEYFITDYESDFDFKVSEYDNIHDLISQAATLAELDEYELEVVSAIMGEGYTLEAALDEYENAIIWSNCNDMTDVAYAYIEETGLLDSCPEPLRNYFDYESFGRDMSFDAQFIFMDNGDCIEICY